MELSDTIFIALIAAGWVIGVALLGLTAARVSRRNRRTGRRR